MEKLTMQKFLVRQPAYPEETSTDKFFFDLANRLLEVTEKEHLFPSFPDVALRQCALSVIGYYQDVIADAGVWHAFINENRRLFGRHLPFYETPEDYIEYELNEEDVRFMCWYTLAMSWEKKRDMDPMDPEILKGARRWYDILEEKYEEAPVPEDYHLAHELEVHAAEDREKIMTLANWLYFNCYLMIPANTMNLSKILEEPEVKADDSREALTRRLQKAMSEDPTGPLALYVKEWVYLILHDKMPPKPRKKEDEEAPAEHPYYTAFMQATGGKRIQYFSNYSQLNRFFIEALGWSQGEDHLPQLKNSSDFVLLVNPEKGMLLAKGVARCIADPENPLYDPAYAYKHAFELLTVRGRCPGDLLNFIYEHKWLPDAHFPGNGDLKLVAENWIFIARCYLQQYYVGD